MSRNKTALRVKENNEKKRHGRPFIFLNLKSKFYLHPAISYYYENVFLNRETREIVVSCQNAETKLLKNY